MTMQHISDAQVNALVSPIEAQQALTNAFHLFGQQQAAMQARIRTESQGIKLSTLGAVIPGLGVAGAKVYTTINGNFSFIILLFSAEDGRPLASFDAGAITRLRTAACTVIASRYLARSDSKKLALFGSGIQGLEHLRQLAGAFALEQVNIVTTMPCQNLAAQLSDEISVQVAMSSTQQALDGADLIVTASRSTTPLFPGQWLPSGAFIAAIGSSLPTTRELDDEAIRRASVIAVEWRKQTLAEAGDLVLVPPELRSEKKIVELGELVTGQVNVRRHPEDITIYKSVGIGLEDIAIAGLAWRRLTSGSGG
jgi:ornithine cyclodeaminase